jgi:hypothetical protein
MDEQKTGQVRPWKNWLTAEDERVLLEAMRYYRDHGCQDDYKDLVINTLISELNVIEQRCKCGSGLHRYKLVDARGIFCDYVCGECEATVKKKYRSDVFTNSNYWTDEPVEPDEW